jgi:hypothetical protein
MVCNYHQRSIPALVRLYPARVVTLLLVLAGLAICPARALGATASLQVTVTNSDGSANNGQVGLGHTITVASYLVNVATDTRVWQLTGPGTLTLGGAGNAWAVYYPPTIMPTPSTATIKVWLTSTPTLTTSYQVTLVNPLPTLTRSSPTQAASGATATASVIGTGFVSGTTLTSNIGTVTTSYTSYYDVTAQITLPAGASGNLILQATNPAPGGGTSTSLSIPIATISATATNPDGTNTGTARLGVPVTFSSVDTDTLYPTSYWAAQGAGSIVGTGTNNNSKAIYTPPQVMPPNPVVTVLVSAMGLSALATSYTMSLINPVPAVTSATPTQLLTGGTQTVTLAGSGFVTGTTVVFNGTTLPITYIDYNDASVQVPVAGNAAGTLTLQVKNPAP